MLRELKFTKILEKKNNKFSVAAQNLRKTEVVVQNKNSVETIY